MAALTTSLIGLGVGGSVAAPSYTFVATYGAVASARCMSVLLDVTPGGFTNLSLVEDALDAKRIEAVPGIVHHGVSDDQRVSPAQNLYERSEVPQVIYNAAGLVVERATYVVEPSAESYTLHATKPFGVEQGDRIFAPSSATRGITSAISFGFGGHIDGYRSHPGRRWGINGMILEFDAVIGVAAADEIDGRVE